ncbi:hypothetical protein [Novosphingobium kaempferiae]|uniref:hypothetical protein n=1 Tax=Novosphingobium kaempferiae TaxID=2896849 RepID=UPI001E605517|nr:hypothetical protein [Novosphingobium kaempferiae]
MTATTESARMHDDLKNIGLRAQATAAGLVQLCKELNAVGVLDQAAVDRVKHAIADEIALTAPRPIPRASFRREVCERLDALFAGDEKVGSAERLSFASKQ